MSPWTEHHVPMGRTLCPLGQDKPSPPPSPGALLPPTGLVLAPFLTAPWQSANSPGGQTLCNLACGTIFCLAELLMPP